MTTASREFQIFVKPAGALCNLNCSYCYYLDKKHLTASYGGAVMSDEILDLYIRQHIEASTDMEILFSWHGGEPMLAGLDFYRNAVTIQKKYRPQGKTIINGIQTNATLITGEWGRFFTEENFFVGVSLDGPERYHNINRFDRHTRGSFSAVMKGLGIIRKYGVPYEFLCVVSNDNVHSPLEIYHFFKDQGARFITFLPLVERTSLTGGKVTSRSVRAGDFGIFLSAIFDEWLENDIGSIRIQVFEEALRTAFGREHTLCIFKEVCGGVPVVEMNGDFYSCDHYVASQHLIGNVGNRSVAGMLDDPQQLAFGQAKQLTLPQYCLDCGVLEMCNGECPKNRFIVAPGGEKGLNYLCEGYRYFFSHCQPFVREVARLWKKQG